MSRSECNRRDFLKAAGLGCAAAGLTGQIALGQGGGAGKTGLLKVNPETRFDLSPHLYMQFMEPLGVTDSSVDAAWDFGRDCWREDVVEITKVLAPTLMRWGGCFCSYYRWKEGVGRMDERVPMINMLWGGLYNNQVGTHEFVDLCRQVGADPLIVVNFESDGRKHWMVDPKGSIRKGTAAEAAEWVDYCNNPSNALRISHGHGKPYGVKLWQVGNETSYGTGTMDSEAAARMTAEYSRAMRAADPDIDIIGWGEGHWCEDMCKIAGEHLQYIAYHNGFGPGGEDSPLRGIEYRKDPARTWEFLMLACREQERKIQDMRERVAGYDLPLAMTECHYGLPGRNRNEVLSTWAAGVSYARVMNVHERNGDVLKITTLADYCGTRWQNNAVMVPVPYGKSFMMPVAMMMSLYRKHAGEKAVDVAAFPDGLDVTASRTGDRVFLHVVNVNRDRSVAARLDVDGMTIKSGKVFWFDPDPEFEVIEYLPELTFPKEGALADDLAWTFPAASVSAVELDIEPA